MKETKIKTNYTQTNLDKVEVENPRKAQKKRENQKVTNWEKKKRKEQETG